MKEIRGEMPNRYLRKMISSLYERTVMKINSGQLLEASEVNFFSLNQVNNLWMMKDFMMLCLKITCTARNCINWGKLLDRNM
jgi:hypothetical protein